MINTFRDKYDWLSNFYKVKIVIKGVEFNSVENAYMSMKSTDVEWVKFCEEKSPVLVKKKSRSIDVRSDWDDIKLKAMDHCLKQKFNQEPFRTKLINTLDENIVEGNWWGDVFWGVNLKVDPNVGENHLGRLIMEIRKELV